MAGSLVLFLNLALLCQKFSGLKLKHVFLTVGLVLLLDQILKIYIKTHFAYGEELPILGHWFRLHFIENEGMAFGMKFGERGGKLFLTLFRLVAVVWGFYYIQTQLIKRKYHNGLILCSSLILAGAMGNLIDSLFYGKIFTESSFHVARWVDWGKGYGDFLHGKVVDMLYFPILSGIFPQWVPFWGGQDYEFFRPVFNLADFSISFGVIAILVFQRRLLRHADMEQPGNSSLQPEPDPVHLPSDSGEPLQIVS